MLRQLMHLQHSVTLKQISLFSIGKSGSYRKIYTWELQLFTREKRVERLCREYIFCQQADL
jgi:hypothetical protein